MKLLTGERSKSESPLGLFENVDRLEVVKCNPPVVIKHRFRHRPGSPLPSVDNCQVIRDVWMEENHSLFGHPKGSCVNSALPND